MAKKKKKKGKKKKSEKEVEEVVEEVPEPVPSPELVVDWEGKYRDELSLRKTREVTVLKVYHLPDSTRRLRCHDNR